MKAVRGAGLYRDGRSAAGGSGGTHAHALIRRLWQYQAITLCRRLTYD